MRFLSRHILLKKSSISRPVLLHRCYKIHITFLPILLLLDPHTTCYYRPCAFPTRDLAPPPSTASTILATSLSVPQHSPLGNRSLETVALSAATSSQSSDTPRNNPTDSAALLSPPLKMTPQSSSSSLEPTTTTHSNLSPKQPSPPPKNHICFLVHGWLGNDLEMSYLERAIDKAIVGAVATTDEGGDHKFYVYKTIDNVGRTNDGVSAGGERLAREVEAVIRSRVALWETEEGTDNDPFETKSVSLSFVGNSLGGLYARYAISLLHQRSIAPSSSSSWGSILLPPSSPPSPPIHIHLHSFYTTATPHLGVASHTYLPIPRGAERVIGTVLGTTGRDLFRHDSDDGIEETEDVVSQMCLRGEFLRPLAGFRRRVAYVNAFGTDFQVPTRTAAFLSEGSQVKHFVRRRGTREEQEAVVVTVRTEKCYDGEDDGGGCIASPVDDEVTKMSVSLDSLGWTKVFLDVRNLSPLPGIKIPFMRYARDAFDELLHQKLMEGRRRRRSSSSSSSSSSVPIDNNDDDDIVLTSSELAQYLSTGETVSLPLGHTVMVANAKSNFYAELNKGGQPVMDALARDLVTGIVNWTVDEGEGVCDGASDEGGVR